MKPLRRAVIATALVAVLTVTACSSLAETVDRARAVADAALAAERPTDAAWLVVADGRVDVAASSDEAFARLPDAPHRYVFRAGEDGDRKQRIAYVPAAGVVAGQGLVEALGLRLRRSVRDGLVLSRDVRRIVADERATVTMRVAAPDGRAAATLRVVLDPEFDGTLLLAPGVAEALGLRRFEIPGEVDVHVALGRPFLARRARVRVEIDALGVSGPVEAIHPLSRL